MPKRGKKGVLIAGILRLYPPPRLLLCVNAGHCFQKLRKTGKGEEGFYFLSRALPKIRLNGNSLFAKKFFVD